MVKGVANIWMPVQDIERAVDFYENVLDLPVVKRDGPWAEVDASGVRVGLNGREPEGAEVEGGPVLTFQPEGGLEEAVDDLKERGVEFPVESSEHDWGRDLGVDSKVQNQRRSGSMLLWLRARSKIYC
jgi:catechol 2,3-dioxygenase-like lactoylglutathione lyase family enzyme